MEFKDMIISLALVALVTIALIMFAVGIQVDNGVSNSNSILNNPVVSNAYTSLNKSIGEAGGFSDTQMEAFNEDVPTLGFGSLMMSSIVGVGKNIFKFMGAIAKTMISFVNLAIGDNPVVVSAFWFIVVVSFLLGIWRVIRQG